MNWLIGLGNPGMAYRRTRHNAGFMVVDAFADLCGGPVRTRRTRACNCLYLDCNGTEITAVKPLLFMNRSGVAISDLPIHLERDSLLVVHDDASMDFGRLRFRREGSAGGQKGMADILLALKTQAVPRLKIGIGKNENMPLEDYVLRPFTGAERKELPDLIDRAAEAVRAYFLEGIDVAMNQFNTKDSAPGER